MQGNDLALKWNFKWYHHIKFFMLLKMRAHIYISIGKRHKSFSFSADIIKIRNYIFEHIFLKMSRKMLL